MDASSKTPSDEIIISKSVLYPFIGVLLILLFLCFYTYTTFFDAKGALAPFASNGFVNVIFATILVMAIDSLMVVPLVAEILKRPFFQRWTLGTYICTHVMVLGLAGFIFGFISGSYFIALSMDWKRWPGLIAYIVAGFIAVSLLVQYPFLELCGLAPNQLDKAQCFTSKAIIARQVSICDYIPTNILSEDPSLINDLKATGTPPSETINLLRTLCYATYANTTNNLSSCYNLEPGLADSCYYIATGQ